MDEEKYLKHALYELRMNFVEEKKKDTDENSKKEEPPKDENQKDTDETK